MDFGEVTVLWRVEAEAEHSRWEWGTRGSSLFPAPVSSFITMGCTSGCRGISAPWPGCLQSCCFLLVSLLSLAEASVVQFLKKRSPKCGWSWLGLAPSNPGEASSSSSPKLCCANPASSSAVSSVTPHCHITVTEPLWSMCLNDISNCYVFSLCQKCLWWQAPALSFQWGRFVVRVNQDKDSARNWVFWEEQSGSPRFMRQN